MSCGQIALHRAGFKGFTYYASEIDKAAIKVTMANYPRTKQLGDVTAIKAIDLPHIDLFIGGSPCQGFSFAGKQLNFEHAESKLFFEYVRLLRECKPDYFLLENVKMKPEYRDIISEQVGVQPIEINSALVSAQTRKRLYWTNIPVVGFPADRNVRLASVLEHDEVVLDKYRVPFTPSRVKMWEGKCKNITDAEKASCLVTKQDRWNSQGLIAYKDFCRFLTPKENERLQTVPDDYTSMVADKERDRMLGNGWTVDIIAWIFSHIEWIDEKEINNALS
jgi:site-specific DNA-cytosine methylase